MQSIKIEVSVQIHFPASIPLKKNKPGTHWTWDLAGPTFSLDFHEKQKISYRCGDSNGRQSTL